MITSAQSGTGGQARLANTTVVVWTLFLVLWCQGSFFIDHTGSWIAAIMSVWVIASYRWQRFPPHARFWNAGIGQRLTLLCCLGVVVLLPIPKYWWLEYPNHSAFLLDGAVTEGNLAQVRSLLDAGTDPNKAPCPYGDFGNGTPLCLACAAGHVDVVSLLLDRGANIEKGDLLDASPLVTAAATGHVAVVRLLLARGARINRVSLPGYPASSVALRQAAVSGQTATVEELLRHGANANQRDDVSPSLIALVRQVGTNPGPMISLLRRYGGKG